MARKRSHAKVLPTKANCEQDFRDKLKLSHQFEEFKKLLQGAARSSSDVQKLVIPLNRLEKAVKVAAWGRHFVLNPKKRHQS